MRQFFPPQHCRTVFMSCPNLRLFLAYRSFLCIFSKNQKYSGAKRQKNKNTTKFCKSSQNFGVFASKIKNTPEQNAKKTKILRNSASRARISEYLHQKSKILRSETPKKQKYYEILQVKPEFWSICIKNQKYSGAKRQKNKNTTKFCKSSQNFGVFASKIKNTPERNAKNTKILRNTFMYSLTQLMQ